MKEIILLLAVIGLIVGIAMIIRDDRKRLIRNHCADVWWECYVCDGFNVYETDLRNALNSDDTRKMQTAIENYLEWKNG